MLRWICESSAVNDELRARAKELREMAAVDAAEWLVEEYHRGGNVIVLLEHVSLRKADYLRLADLYLSGATLAHGRPYRLFAERLGLEKFTDLIARTGPRSPRDASLLAYHLRAILSDAWDTANRTKLSELVVDLESHDTEA